MSEKDKKPKPERDENRLEPFLDCVAYLIAKRWLHDQCEVNDVDADSNGNESSRATLEPT